MKRIIGVLIAGIFVTACANKAGETSETPHQMVDSTKVVITEINAADLPASVATLVKTKRPDFTAEEIQKKVRDGRTYYDIEGTIGNGDEIGLDVLMEAQGPVIVEIQRDIGFSDLSTAVQQMAMKASGDVSPARIIESIQTDESVIFEFFNPGSPSDPAYEIQVKNDEAKLLDERWEH